MKYTFTLAVLFAVITRNVQAQTAGICYTAAEGGAQPYGTCYYGDPNEIAASCPEASSPEASTQWVRAKGTLTTFGSNDDLLFADNVTSSDTG
ncbi:hypothetical protein PRZ48_013903 [Zasmidium cellare]|uniref:Uncharacterized protein n=1 Tax=Zasmidium cellare TaxID=395010 RepID=A0ABR0DZE7_ZASCE|nr:hypothetical protein PRZ48_013903 [Zasmidium cellare]